jgi:hypothetical protein
MPLAPVLAILVGTPLPHGPISTRSEREVWPLSFECLTVGSTTKTTVKSVTTTAEKSDKYFMRWVFFAKLIETCGNISRKELKSVGTRVDCPATICGRCDGKLQTFQNVCSVTPRLENDSPVVFWALRETSLLSSFLCHVLCPNNVDVERPSPVKSDGG